MRILRLGSPLLILATYDLLIEKIGETPAESAPLLPLFSLLRLLYLEGLRTRCLKESDGVAAEIWKQTESERRTSNSRSLKEHARSIGTGRPGSDSSSADRRCATMLIQSSSSKNIVYVASSHLQDFPSTSRGISSFMHRAFQRGAA